MKSLLTEDLERRLLANGRVPSKTHAPIVKLFNPLGPATWLVSEMDADHDSLFGLADLGVGCPELGWFSHREIARLRPALGLGITRDLYFRTSHSITVWADYARATGSIAAAERLLSSLEP